MEKLVGGNGDKIDFDALIGLHHADFLHPEKIAVKGVDFCPEDDGFWLFPVGGGGGSVNFLERAGKGLVGGKPVINGDFQKTL